MEKEIIKNAYECMFIVDVSAGTEAVAPTVQKFVNLVDANGEIVDVAEWGKRRLEYPINDKNEGYYTVITFKATSEFPSELERLFNIDESVMRSLVVKIPEEVAEKAARRAADKANAAATEEAAAEEAAPEEAAPAEEVATADAE